MSEEQDDIVVVRPQCPVHGIVGERHTCKPQVEHKCYRCDPPRDVTVIVEVRRA